VANQKRTTVWASADGRTRRTELYGLASLAGVQAALAAASNAGELQHWEGDLVASVPAPSAASFPSVQDLAILLYADGAGVQVQVRIPAPKDTCFLADGETMDGAGPGQAVGAALLTYGASQDGVAFDSVIGGYRTRSKTQRRFGVRTRNPVLTGQGL
jgi:hypothetical protein